MHAAAPPLWTVAPFAALLLAIGVLPLVAPHWWERPRHQALVAALCGLPVVLYCQLALGAYGRHVLLERAEEYVSFVALLGALFVVTGGIHVRGAPGGTPGRNLALLALGALLASVIGTTGASVLLVRPLLRSNAPRARKTHVFVFFLFVVSNCGGLLTPLGDPPLFLGFLKGVPFAWTLRLVAPWLVVNGTLLAVFFVLDRHAFVRERGGAPPALAARREPIGIEGGWNGALLAAIVATLVASGSGVANGGAPWPFGAQEALLACLTGLAYAMTPARLRAANAFSFAQIVEVAILFAGLFAAMAPPLLLLHAHALALGLREPWQFFWATGALSAFLDNAPTYLAFAAAAAGIAGVPLEGRYLADYLALGPHAAETLAAISCGAVFMGANSYVGNGPNLMVKAIVERGGVRMPSFFGYVAWSSAVLLPLYALTGWLFL